MKVTGIEVPWREGELDFRGVVGYAAIGDRAAVATGDEVVIGSAPLDQLPDAQLIVHDAKALRVDARDDTLLAAYLIDPGPRRATSSTISPPSTASSCCRRPTPRRRRRLSSGARRHRAA